MTTESRRVSKLTDLTQYKTTSERLPYWARSTNPIVRRHLGLYWRTIPPEIRPFLTIYLVWAGIMLVGMVFPPLFGFTMLSFLASIMIVPVMMVLYAHVLLSVAIDAARHMQAEMKNNTFELLQATPMSLPQIFLGKVAAAIWKRMDDLIMVAQVAIAFGPPIIFTFYTELWPVEQTSVITPLATMIAAFVSLLRILLEPLMVGVISVFVGLVVPGRSRAISSAVVLSAFYFLLINLLAHLPSVRGATLSDGTILPTHTTLLILFDFVLPVVLPLALIWGLLKLATYIVTND